MNAQSLKTIIAVNLAVLLLIAVLLMNLISVATGQKTLVQNQTAQCRWVSSAIQACLMQDGTLTSPLPERVTNTIQHHLGPAGIVTAVILSPNRDLLHWNRTPQNPLRHELVTLTERTLITGREVTAFSEKAWGVFFIRHRYLMMAFPLAFQNGEIAASLGMAVDLAPFYAQQRETQTLIFIYGFFNILILTVLGTYVISRASVKPIHRLVKIAEGYREDSEFSPFYDRERNEFRQLSISLNRMVRRISKDKQQLQASLADLENANMEIKKRQNEIIRAEKLASVGRLSAGIAHEIGNPIGIVLGYLDMLGQPDLTETEKADYLKRCESEINRINTIIRELLDFSRPTPQTEARISVHDIITETLTLLEVQPLMKSVTTRIALDAAHHHVYAPPGKLRQVFVNLLINAADAVSMTDSNRAPVVEIISVNRHHSHTPGAPPAANGFIEVAIKDNGPGIADKDMDNIFDPFYTTKEPGKGTGLGLSVCFMIIESLGGRIIAESPPDLGTTITVSLPLAATEK